jgi:hypothetical protein
MMGKQQRTESFVLPFPLRRPDSQRSPAPTHWSAHRFQFCPRATDGVLQCNGPPLDRSRSAAAIVIGGLSLGDHQRTPFTNQARMPTTVQKESRHIIEVSGAVVRTICIARRKHNAKAVHKRNCAPRAPIGDYLFIGRNRCERQFAHWPERPRTDVRNELATRSKLYSPSSSNRSSCAACDYDDYGMSLGSFIWRQRRKT